MKLWKTKINPYPPGRQFALENQVKNPYILKISPKSAVYLHAGRFSIGMSAAHRMAKGTPAMVCRSLKVTTVPKRAFTASLLQIGTRVVKKISLVALPLRKMKKIPNVW
jgi:hypothetical protein